jgi:hypothetical protein
LLPATARGRFGAAISVAAVAGVLLGIALHVEGPRSSPSFALPLFHGQADWAPGQRRAPAFALRDQDGQAVSLASQRGDPLLIAFLDTAGDRRSGAIAVSLAEAEALLPRSGRPILDIISLNPAADSPARIRGALGPELHRPALRCILSTARASSAPVTCIRSFPPSSPVTSNGSTASTPDQRA